MNPVKANAWDWLMPLPKPGRMIELGDKCSTRGSYKSYFRQLGWDHVSIDLNGKHGALKLDLRERHELEPADVVTNIGTSEHVDPQGFVWQNIVDWMKVGGLLVSITPLPGDWGWHGRFYPSPRWYFDFCRLNSLMVTRIGVTAKPPMRVVNVRAVKLAEVGDVILPDSGLHENHPEDTPRPSVHVRARARPARFVR